MRTRSAVIDSVDPPARAAVAPTLQHWKRDPNLASVRDADALAALPEAERADWEVLWAELDHLLGRAGVARSTPHSLQVKRVWCSCLQ